MSEQCAPTKTPIAQETETKTKSNDDIDILEEEEKSDRGFENTNVIKEYPRESGEEEDDYVDLDWPHEQAQNVNKNLKPDITSEEPEVKFDASGSDRRDDDDEDEDEDEEGSGGGGGGDDGDGAGSGGNFEVEWSAWGDCRLPHGGGKDLCGKGRKIGRQFRTSRCTDSPRMTDCIAAGKERVESRPCTVELDSLCDDEDVEKITMEDVEKVKSNVNFFFAEGPAPALQVMRVVVLVFVSDTKFNFTF